MTHWVTVMVAVPVRTDHPSPVKAEFDAAKKVELALNNPLGSAMLVTSASYSRTEP